CATARAKHTSSDSFRSGCDSSRPRAGGRRSRADVRRSESPPAGRYTMKWTALLALFLLPITPLFGQDDWLKQAATKKVATFDGSNAGSPPDVKKDRREKVVIRRLKPSCKSDWNTDPTALPYFFYQLRERTKRSEEHTSEL